MSLDHIFDRRTATLALPCALVACGGAAAPSHASRAATATAPNAGASDAVTAPAATNAASPSAAHASTACVKGATLKVHFYDAGQALSALVTLPDGRRWLVDAGESPTRTGCGGACEAWHEGVMAGLRRDLGGLRLDGLWITHQHSDHLGGAPDVLRTFGAALYVDNGVVSGTHAHTRAHDGAQSGAHDVAGGVHDTVTNVARRAASESGARLRVVDPDHADTPIASSPSVTITPIVPIKWPARCPSDPNACSIALRIDYCESSILFTGDAPSDEESALDTRGEVTLLQVGHHGSDTSTSAAFVRRLAPRYAVIASGKPDEGTNKGYCHPRATTVRTLTAAMGGAGKGTVRSYDGKRCDAAHADAAGTADGNGWIDVPSSDHLWATARDGDVELRTIGDGVFSRAPSSGP